MRFVSFAVITYTALSLLPATGQDFPEYKIESAILGETRTIQVSRPDNFESRDRKLPLLIALDGPWHMDHLDRTREALYFSGHPNVVVIGIEHESRGRDMKFKPDEESPDGGNANKFLEFIEQELIPFAEKEFNTSEYRIFYGHSAGGGFGVYALLEKPELFDAYILATPNLWWDDYSLVKAFQKRAAKGEFADTVIYTELSNELGEERQGVIEFSKVIKNYSNPNWGYFHRENENHNSMTPLTGYFGLKSVFADYFLTGDLTRYTAKEAVAHFQTLATIFGYDPRIPQSTLAHLVASHKLGGDLEEALKFAEIFAETYPTSSYGIFSYGELLDAMGRYCDAAQTLDQIGERYGADEYARRLREKAQPAECPMTASED